MTKHASVSFSHYIAFFLFFKSRNETAPGQYEHSIVVFPASL